MQRVVNRGPTTLAGDAGARSREDLSGVVAGRDTAADSPWPPHINVRSALLTAIFTLLLLHAMYAAAAILIPITLALLFSLLLSPLVKRMGRLRVPTPIGAMIAVAFMVVVLAAGLYVLVEPASLWMEQAPSALRRLEATVEALREPIEEIQEAAETVGNLAPDGGDADDVVEVRVETTTFSDAVLSAAPSTMASVATIFILMYFMLASGDRFLRRLVEQIPRFEDKKATVETVRAIQGKLSAYLFTISVINLVLGIATAATMHVLAVPNPLLWGTMAGLLNFAPYVGPMLMTLIFTFVGFATYDTAGPALLPPLLFFALTTLEGQLITPFVAGRRLELNPVAIVLTIIFLGWIWGVVGVLIAVPILVCAKIICERIEPMKPLAVFLERYPA